MTREIYVNLPVRDLKKSVEFFRGLGFEFQPKFTNDQAACMIVNPSAYVMLLPEPFFQTFTKRGICDTDSSTEALLAVSCVSRAEVGEMGRKAVELGGSRAMDPVDHGFMYGWSFLDPDGHQWELIFMEKSAEE